MCVGTISNCGIPHVIDHLRALIPHLVGAVTQDASVRQERYMQGYYRPRKRWAKKTAHATANRSSGTVRNSGTVRGSGFRAWWDLAENDPWPRNPDGFARAVTVVARRLLVLLERRPVDDRSCGAEEDRNAQAQK